MLKYVKIFFNKLLTNASKPDIIYTKVKELLRNCEYEETDMKIIKCPNGHFFDGDSFQECPHCPSETKKEKARFLKKNGTASTTSGESVFSGFSSVTEKRPEPANSGFVCEPTEVLYVPEEAKPEDIPILPYGKEDFLPPPDTADDSSSLLFSTFSGYDKKEGRTSGAVPPPLLNTDSGLSEVSGAQQDVSKAEDTVKCPLAEEQADNSDGSAGTAGASSDPADPCSVNASMNKPVSISDCASGSEENTAQSDEPACQANTPAFEDKGFFDPVVGWLVCTSGQNAGKSYELFCGRNSAGNSRVHTVVLEEGSARSSDAVFYILFVPESDTFLISPGTSRELVYLNRFVLTDTDVIDENDEIRTHRSSYRLVRYCGRLTSFEKYGETPSDK